MEGGHSRKILEDDKCLCNQTPARSPHCQEGTDYLTRCDFNDDARPYCDWVQSVTTDDGDWRRTSGTTHTVPSTDHPAPWENGSETGRIVKDVGGEIFGFRPLRHGAPVQGLGRAANCGRQTCTPLMPAGFVRRKISRLLHGAGYYIYQDISSFFPKQFVRLESPIVNVSEDVCVEFSYHMYAAYDNGTTLKVLVRDSNQETLLWNRTMPQSHSWLSGGVTVPVRTAKQIQIIFEAVRGQSEDGDPALDNVAITTGPCFSCVYGCDFDVVDDLCGWTTETHVGDADDYGWQQWLGQTETEHSGPNDDFSKPGFGYYMLLESANNKPGHKFHLKSPSVNSPQCLSLTFYYYLYGTAKTMAINVYTLQQGASSESLLLSIEGDKGQQWRKAEVVHCGALPVQFVIEGVRGETAASDIAVDKVCIFTCDGPAPSTMDPLTTAPSIATGLPTTITITSLQMTTDPSTAITSDPQMTTAANPTTAITTPPTTTRTISTAPTQGSSTGTIELSSLGSTTSGPTSTLYESTTRPSHLLDCYSDGPVKDYLTRCDFNDDAHPYCDWVQSATTDDGDWRRTSGTTHTVPSTDHPAPWENGSETGRIVKDVGGEIFGFRPLRHGAPVQGLGRAANCGRQTCTPLMPAGFVRRKISRLLHGAGYYIYQDISSFFPKQFVRLESPIVNVSEDVCVEFSYHMYAAYDNGTTLKVLVRDSNQETLLWNRTMPQSHSWLSGGVTVPVRTAKQIQIIFEAVRGQSEDGDPALDNVAITTGPCFSCVYGCDFDVVDDLCGWTTETHVGDADDYGWQQWLGQTETEHSGPNDDFSKPGFGYYMLLESANNKPGHKFHLKSPSVNSPQCLSLTFYYYLYGTAKTMAINVYTLQQGASSESLLLSIEGDKGQQWRKAEVVHCGALPVQFVIEGVRGETAASDIAVDKVCIFTCNGPAPSTMDPLTTAPSIATGLPTTITITSLQMTTDPSTAITSDPQMTTAANPTTAITTPPTTTRTISTAPTQGSSTGTIELSSLGSTTSGPTSTLYESTTRPSHLLDCYSDGPVKDYLTRCDFNDDAHPYCDWVQSATTDDGDWRRTSGTTHTVPSTDHPAPWENGSETGRIVKDVGGEIFGFRPLRHGAPVQGLGRAANCGRQTCTPLMPAGFVRRKISRLLHGAGYYIYQDISSFFPKQFVRLESPIVNVSEDVCVEFSYHMYAAYDNGTTLKVLVRDSNQETLLWNRTMPQSHSWLSGGVTVPVRTAKQIQIIFEAVRGQSEDGDPALDNVAITTGPCFSCVYGCDFDVVDDLCGWTTETHVGDADDYGWQQWLGQTETEHSGPNDDFSKPGFGYYMLLESANNKPGHKFHLKSPSVNSPQCLSLTFYYYLYGTAKTMAINVYTLQQGASSESLLLSIEGDKGQQWRKAEVVHCGALPVQFVIEGVRGETAASDIAVDKVCIFTCDGPAPSTMDPLTTAPSIATGLPTTITITSLQMTTDPSTEITSDPQMTTAANPTTAITTPPTTTRTISTAPTQGSSTGTIELSSLGSTTSGPTSTLYESTTRPSHLLDCYSDGPVKDYLTRCDFNDDAHPYCDWVQSATTDDGDWRRTSGTTHTVPSTDHPAPWENGSETGYYIYQDISSFFPKQFVRLESPIVNVSEDVCVEFSYHMYAAYDNGTTLKVLVRDSNQETLLWNRTMPQSHSWLSGGVTVPVRTAKQIQIIFEAVRGQSEDGDPALDNVAITTGPCFSCVYGCDFDVVDDLCGWTTETHVGDADDYGWQQWLGQTETEHSGPNDDFSKPGFGYYMLLESANNKPGHKFHLKSPSVNSPQCLSLTFYYYLYGTAKTMAINVYTLQQGASSESLLLSIEGDKGQQWRKAEVVHCGALPVQFVIEGVRGETAASDIAVDKVCIFTCDGPAPSTMDPLTTAPSIATGLPTTITITSLQMTTDPSTEITSDPQMTTAANPTTAITTPPTTTRTISTAPTQGSSTGTIELSSLGSTTSGPTSTLYESTTRSPWLPECDIVKDYITRCDFNDNLKPYCDWTQKCDTDNGEWIRTNGETPSAHTGPSSDYPAPWEEGQKKGYYIYLETSNFVAKQFVRLESQTLNVSGDVCVEFSYHMYGARDDGAMLKVLVGDGPRETLLWNRTMPQSRSWLSGGVTVPVQTAKDIRVIFEAVRGLTEAGDTALDNIAVTAGPCFSCMHGCDFDVALDLCGWTSETYLGDANDKGWKQSKASTDPDHTGPTDDFSKPGFGYYMLLESANNKPGHKFHLKSPSVNSPQCLSLTFYYYLYGTAKTMAINVYTLQQGILGGPLINIAGNQGQRWRKAEAVYCGASPIQFVIEGVRGETAASDIAVDKVCILACAGVTTTPGSTTGGITTPETTTGVNTTPETTTGGITTPETTTGVNTTPETTTGVNTTPETTTGVNTTPETTTGGITTPETTTGVNTTPETTTGVNTTPRSTTGVNTTPETTTDVITTPRSTTGVITTPRSTTDVITTPGSTTDVITTPGSTTDVTTTPETTTDVITTPGSTTDVTTTPRSTTDVITTPGSTTDVTTTPGSTTDVITTPGSTTDVTTTPETTTDVTTTPGSTTDVITTPGSTTGVITTPGSTTGVITTPETTTGVITTPGSTTDVITTPGSTTDVITTPGSTTDVITTPGSTTDVITTPGSTTGVITTPETTTGVITTPGSTTDVITTPETTTGVITTPGSTTDVITTPGSTTDVITTPGSTTDVITTPGSTTDVITTPGSTTDVITTPGSTTGVITTPGSTTGVITTPETTTGVITTPGSTTDVITTPGSTTDVITTPGSTTDVTTTPGSTTDVSTTPGSTTDVTTTPETTTGVTTTPETTTDVITTPKTTTDVITTPGSTTDVITTPRSTTGVTTTPGSTTDVITTPRSTTGVITTPGSTTAEGSCIISGDPHYLTFDSRKFIFLGTCTYTLARSCQNKTGPWFSIEGKNEERGLPGATYLRKLYITFDDITITLMKNRRILVGETRIRLPKSLGRAHLSQSGQYVFVKTDFGLLVQYDGNHFVKIVVPGSYTGQMCGLCGDFNGDDTDDYRKPDGTMALNDTIFGDSWKTKDDEEERCRSIDPIPCEKDIYDKVISTDQCGLITDTVGPFRDCAKIVDPMPYFNNCVYDMCQFQGFQPPLCDQLQAYTDACLSAGATVHSWRTPDFCAPSCPPNSHHDMCASMCPRTCTHPSEPDCSSKCIEGCDCDPGYVLSDRVCVLLSDCGCSDAQGDYHMINESWYLTGCTERCTCLGANRTVCQNAGCSALETCDLLNGVYSCHPKGRETCSASGDPHYKTFDKFYYDFMGNCTYTFSKLCNASSVLPYFNVETSNEHRGRNTQVSYVKAVHVEAYGHRVTITKSRRVILNGRRVRLPVIMGEELEVRVSGAYVSLETDFGLWVRYDGNHHVDVTVPSSYAGQLCGLCGNYNGIKSDDNRKPDGDDTDSFEDLGASWLVPGTDTQCSHDDPPSDCDEDEFKEPWSCGFIKDPNGPFKECNKQIPPEQYFKDCVYDMSCATNDEMASLCFALQSYAAICAQAGVPVTWRNKTFCPLSCPAGSHYDPCGSACPSSCTDLAAPNDCGRPCVESCVCDHGYVLSGDQCVAFSQCGCVDAERNYRLLGENWITTGNCTERCTCSGPSNITCTEWECGPQEMCGVQDGELDCHTTGSASCHVAGDPHYYTFDNAMHTFLGTCTYTLVTTCNATMVTAFTISAKNEERGLPYASYLSLVHIDVYGLRFTMKKSRRLLLDNKKIRTPFEDHIKGISIYSSGIYNVLETRFGLMVRFDGNNHLEIKLPNTYYGKVCGMCGNFNNNGADDLLMPNGLPANNVTHFGNSWRVEGDKDPRCQSDDREDLNPLCTPEEKAVMQARCEELLSAKYQQCHSVVKPASFIENCVYDLCMYDGMVSTLCDNIQSYVEACRSEKVDIKWRNSTFCPLSCQENSHSTECASACPATCVNIYSPANCESTRPCVEGCECDSGFVLSDDRCITLENCGCVDYNNNYHESGDSWLNERCDTKCTCRKGQLRCKKHRCGDNAVCALTKDGKYKCRPVSFETCLISGDPHYLTFDGLVHYFQGKGTYTLTTTFNASETLQPFNIEGKNQVRSSNKKVSFLSAVYIDVYGHSIEFHKNKRFLLDDERVKPPYKSREGFQVYQKSKTLYLETDFGLSVNFDGKENADIIIPSLYKRKVRGLCGNYDGRYRNDFTLPDGTRVSDLNVFGNSWKVADKEDEDEDEDDDDEDEDDSDRMGKQVQLPNTRRYKRAVVEEDPEPETGFLANCTREQQAVINSTASCGAISDPRGPFRDCHRLIAPETYHRNCLFDLCQFYNNAEMLCASFGVYAQVCQANGTKLQSWRLETGCAMTCPPHSSYKPCMAVCPPTCANLAAPSECDMPCQEGCQCDRGYVYSGFDCVPYSQCGCTYQNKYYEVGQRFITESCTEDCSCNMTENVQCLSMRCPENTTCTIANSIRACEKIKPNCSMNTCQNGGTCKQTANGIMCLCPSFYEGQYCENITNIIIVGVVVPVVILLIIGAVLIYIFCCRNGGTKASDRMSDSSSLSCDIEFKNIIQSWQTKQDGRHGISNPEYSY
ncbi:zonadhesin-like [Heptranchias perlo]|uniref:zonadhesin-like n=1 Tax=Heptranchias perlo TaxID=212740 RepID=UPI00355A8CB0